RTPTQRRGRRYSHDLTRKVISAVCDEGTWSAGARIAMPPVTCSATRPAAAVTHATETTAGYPEHLPERVFWLADPATGRCCQTNPRHWPEGGRQSRRSAPPHLAAASPANSASPAGGRTRAAGRQGRR